MNELRIVGDIYVKDKTEEELINEVRKLYVETFNTTDGFKEVKVFECGTISPKKV